MVMKGAMDGAAGYKIFVKKVLEDPDEYQGTDKGLGNITKG